MFVARVAAAAAVPTTPFAPTTLGGHPVPPPPEPTDMQRIGRAVTFAGMATNRFGLAKEAFASAGVTGAVGQLEHVSEAVNGMFLNLDLLAPEHQQPALRERILNALMSAEDLRLDSIRGQRPDEFLARCDAQVAELAAIVVQLHDVHF